MVTGRHRLRRGLPYTGSVFHIPSGTTNTRSIDTIFEACDDIVGNYPNPNPLWIEGYHFNPGVLSGQKPVAATYVFDHWPLDNQGIGGVGHIDGTTDPRYDALALASAITKAQAVTNPSRYDVSVPNFIFELKDIPEMLHRKGSSHGSSRSSNSTVEQNFGWSLLFQDVNRIINFTDSVNKRVRELKGLHKKGGLKRTHKLGSQFMSSYEQDGVTFQSVEAFVTGLVRGKQHRRDWCSVSWQADEPAVPSDEELTRQARLAVHGWDFSSSGVASQIWEALPWSWLGDYFGNLGDFLNATRNSVGATPAVSCLMSTMMSTYDAVITGTSSGFIATGGRYTWFDKTRQVGSAMISASLNVLSAKQLTTLSSIAYNIGR